ncbi:MFS transporter [uncultured Ilyobacter sp.]|uniref:MFS transporter n=1 Tax=uncultured Ilyobacter sp. TaxID=544433 RepID=UPI0029F53446|nr:MFS transporter [uncultured Ilyobacter sp.]
MGESPESRAQSVPASIEDGVATPPRALRPAVALVGQILYMLCYSTLFANIMWLMPMLVRLRFGDDNPDIKDWQTTLVTAAIPTLMMFSIFWAELLSWIRVRTYLLLFWLVAALPLGLISLAGDYWQFLACHVVSCIGFASWPPVYGKLLKQFYPDSIRGRAYAVLNLTMFAGSAGAVYLVGRWLEQRPDAFRMFFVGACAVQLLGVLILIALVSKAGTDTRPPARRGSWKAPLVPLLEMGRLLRQDRTFLRYEAAFMTYGAAFMICEALLPVLATDRLDMRYEEYAHSTQMILRGAMLVLTLPMGWLLDKAGPIRTSGLAFAVLGLYPLLLLVATGPSGVATASLVYGCGLAGVMMGWTLGPILLAGSADKVPLYSGVHASLVGLRGVVFQSLGMLMYKLTGSFSIPLILAATLFAFAAAQMWLLSGKVSDRTPTASPKVS